MPNSLKKIGRSHNPAETSAMGLLDTEKKEANVESPTKPVKKDTLMKANQADAADGDMVTDIAAAKANKHTREDTAEDKHEQKAEEASKGKKNKDKKLPKIKTKASTNSFMEEEFQSPQKSAGKVMKQDKVEVLSPSPHGTQ